MSKAVFEVENFTNYVHTQSEAAVRTSDRTHTTEDEDEITLTTDTVKNTP